MFFQMGPDARCLKHAARRLQHRGRAHVGPFRRTIGDGGRGVDADHVETRGAESRCRRQTGNTAARNQDITCHGHARQLARDLCKKSRKISGVEMDMRRGGGVLGHMDGAHPHVMRGD